MQRLGVDWHALQSTPVSVVRAALVALAHQSQGARSQQLARLSQQTMQNMRR
jgi:hypothetical protein